jgi:hypothetical protein
VADENKLNEAIRRSHALYVNGDPNFHRPATDVLVNAISEAKGITLSDLEVADIEARVRKAIAEATNASDVKTELFHLQ